MSAAAAGSVPPAPAGGAAHGAAFDAAAWVGREERVRLRAVRETVELLEASLDRPLPGDGAALAPLRHWLWGFAPPAPPGAALGPDGHPPRGDLIPDWPLPRRMWAGSTVDFLHDVPLDAPLERHTRLESATVKRGRSGTLGFVVLRHRWLLDGECAIDDAQTIVYREAVDAPAGAVAPATPAAPLPAPAWNATHVPREPLLFRYSAVTFNTHRIHYDAPYATGVEGYPGLVVHGPLIATLMLDAFRDAHPRARVRRFSFRALAPSFCGDVLHAGGTPEGDGRARLWVRGDDGAERLSGEVTFERG